MASLGPVVPYVHQDDGHANYNTEEIGFIPEVDWGICIHALADIRNKTTRNVFKVQCAGGDRAQELLAYLRVRQALRLPGASPAALAST
jgi:hypothetical protein